MLEHCCGNLLPFSHKSISEVGHWCWAIRPGSQLAFQFIPKEFDGVEDSAGQSNYSTPILINHFCVGDIVNLFALGEVVPIATIPHTNDYNLVSFMQYFATCHAYELQIVHLHCFKADIVIPHDGKISIRAVTSEENRQWHWRDSLTKKKLA